MNDFFGRIWSKKQGRKKFQMFDQNHRVFSHDVTAAILMSQNNETAAMGGHVGVPNQSCGS